MNDLDPLTPTAQAAYDRFTADLETGAAARRAAWAHEDFAPGHRPGRTPLSPAQFADAHAAVRAGLDRLTAHAPRWAHWTDFVARVEAAVAGAPRTHDGIRAALWRALSDAIAVEYRDASLESIDRAVTAPSAHVRRLGDDPARLVAAWVAIHGIAGEVGTARAIRDLGWCVTRAAAVTGVDPAPLLPSRPPTAAQRAEARARANAAGRRAVDAPAGAPIAPEDVQPGDVAWNRAGVRARVVQSWPTLGRVLIEDGGDEVVVESARLSFVRPPAPEDEAPEPEAPAYVEEREPVIADAPACPDPWAHDAPAPAMPRGVLVEWLRTAGHYYNMGESYPVDLALGQFVLTAIEDPEVTDAVLGARVRELYPAMNDLCDALDGRVGVAPDFNAAIDRFVAERWGEDLDTDAAERAVDEVLAADERDGIRR